MIRIDISKITHKAVINIVKQCVSNNSSRRSVCCNLSKVSSDKLSAYQHVRATLNPATRSLAFSIVFKHFFFFSKKNGGRVGVVVRALAFHQCGPARVRFPHSASNVD